MGRVGFLSERSIPLMQTGMCSQITQVSEASPPVSLAPSLSHTNQYTVHNGAGCDVPEVGRVPLGRLRATYYRGITGRDDVALARAAGRGSEFRPSLVVIFEKCG